MGDEENVEWWARVEYLIDMNTAIVPITWVKDYQNDDALWPAFNPMVSYRVFWSGIEYDSPASMLTRAPEVPVLTQDEEIKSKPGYYRANILGVEGNKEKFASSRQVLNPNRSGRAYGQTVASSKGNALLQQGSRRGGRGGGIRSRTTRSQTLTTGNTSGRQEKAAEAIRKKNRADEGNLGQKDVHTVNLFNHIDAELNDEEEDDDDSDADRTLVSSEEVKVLQTSLKKIKQRLMDKCEEVNDLKDLLKERDNELKAVRDLNISFQQKFFQHYPFKAESLPSLKSLSPGHSSSSLCSTSSSSSSKSMPCFSSGRSTMTSPSLLHIAKKPRMSDVSHTHDDNLSRKQSTKGNGNISHHFKSGCYESKDFINQYGKRSHEAQSDGDFVPSDTDSADRASSSTSHGNLEDPALPLCFLSDGEGHSTDEPSKYTFMDKKESASAKSSEGLDKPLSKPPPLSEIKNEKENNTDDLVVFCDGFNGKVSKSSLTTLEEYALARENDAKYVKDFAVAVFGLKTMYNSTVTGQKARNDKSAKRRHGLNPQAVEEIRVRLENRVKVEAERSGRSLTLEDKARFTKEKVNYHIKEKIKKLRGNKNLQYLDADAAENTENCASKDHADNL